MKTKIYIIVFTLSMLGLVSYHMFFKNNMPEQVREGINSVLGNNPDGLPELDWETLYALDYKTMEGPDKLMKLDGKRVRIPGYIVPLTDNYSQLDEFILVPDSQSCIHVPPPPPNLIVAVKLRDVVPVNEVHNPSWVEGIFKIEYSTSQYGGAAYKLDGIKLIKYEFEDD